MKPKPNVLPVDTGHDDDLEDLEPLLWGYVGPVEGDDETGIAWLTIDDDELPAPESDFFFQKVRGEGLAAALSHHLLPCRPAHGYDDLTLREVTFLVLNFRGRR